MQAPSPAGEQCACRAWEAAAPGTPARLSASPAAGGAVLGGGDTAAGDAAAAPAAPPGVNVLAVGLNEKLAALGFSFGG